MAWIYTYNEERLTKRILEAETESVDPEIPGNTRYISTTAEKRNVD